MAKDLHATWGDGRGIMDGGFIGRERPMDRKKWLEEVFPEWGDYLNKDIQNTKVAPKTAVFWYFGGPSWALKSRQGIFLIDNYSGPSLYTTYDYCGVCRTGGAPTINWLRLNPHVIDPWVFKSLDGVFITHHHQDHCDFFTVKAALQTTKAKFIGPAVTCERLKGVGVPANRIIKVKPGDVVRIKDMKVQIAENFDTIATKTGFVTPKPFSEVAVSFNFNTEGGNVIFLGDTLYHNGYAMVGKKYKIDVAIMDMGHNAPGATDKMSPWDVYRVAEALRAKVVIPDHHDNWGNCQEDPAHLEYIVSKKAPQIKTIVLQAGAKFVLPKDINIGRYHYPDYRELYRPEYSWEYGNPPKEK